MYCSTHSTPPLISKQTFFWGVSNIRRPMGLHMALRLPADPVVQHHSIRPTGRAVGREDLVEKPGGCRWKLQWKAIKSALAISIEVMPPWMVMFGDQVGWDRNVFFDFPRDLWWVSESRSTERRMTSYFFAFVCQRPSSSLDAVDARGVVVF